MKTFLRCVALVAVVLVLGTGLQSTSILLAQDEADPVPEQAPSPEEVIIVQLIDNNPLAIAKLIFSGEATGERLTQIRQKLRSEAKKVMKQRALKNLSELEAIGDITDTTTIGDIKAALE